MAGDPLVTPREWSETLAQGRELGIAHDTVRTRVRTAMTKLGARSRAHLVAKALGEGLLRP